MRTQLGSLIAAAACAILFVIGGQGSTTVSGFTTFEIGIDENMFTVNGTPQFLVFVSYFDAMDVSSTNLNSDFTYLHGKGVDGIRIFPNWWDVRQDVWTHPTDPYYFDANTLIAQNGTLRSSALTKSLQVLDIAKQHSLLVDVSFSAESVAVCLSGNCTAGHPDGSYLSYTNYKNAIATVATTLASYGSAYKHVFFDLQNEYDENGAAGNEFTNSQILSIRNAVNTADPGRIVTASLSHTVPASTAASYQLSTNIDAIAWHEDRVQSFWTLVDDRLADMQSVNPDPPIYLQEPERLRQSNDDWLTKAGFGADVYSARNNGAAAWCFHTGGSFRMDGLNLQSKLQTEEKSFLTCLNSCERRNLLKVSKIGERHENQIASIYLGASRCRVRREGPCRADTEYASVDAGCYRDVCRGTT